MKNECSICNAVTLKTHCPYCGAIVLAGRTYDVANWRPLARAINASRLRIHIAPSKGAVQSVLRKARINVGV